MTSGKYKIKRFQGVFGYNSSTKRCNGKPDICFYITYKVDGRKITEKIGWKSEGYTGQLASEVRAEKIRQARHSGKVKTDKEIRAEQRLKDRTLIEVRNHYFDSEHGKTIKARCNDFNRWKNHLTSLEEKSISDLTLADIERIKSTMATKGLKPATVKHVLALISRVVNHGVKHGLCSPLGFQIEYPKIDNQVTEYLTPEEAQSLMQVLDSMKRQDIARMVKLAWVTGMRRGELFSLKKEDIDFTHSIITLRDPKGGKDATIPLSPPARELIEAQLDHLSKEKKRKKQRYKNTSKPAPPWEEHGYLFPGTYGKRRTSCNAIKRIKKEAGLPESFRPFHGLRHHFAVTLASSGEYTLDMIGQLLTHKDSNVTRRYAKFLPEVQQKAADRAAELLAGQLKQE